VRNAVKLRCEELDRHVAKQLLPVYLVAGEEPLLIRESLDVLRTAARNRGFTEREVLEADAGFDWNRLREAGETRSLFGERRIIELRMPRSKPGTPGSKAIVAYCRAPDPDNLLLVVCERLDSQQRKSQWAEAIQRAGALVYAWPIPVAQLRDWLAGRCRRRGLQPTGEALGLLAERGEGNLLAADQEIEKLELLYGAGPVDAGQIAAAVADSARYDVFALADAAVAGQAPRALRILRGLRAEGIEPTLILWALSRELRAIAAVAAAPGAGAVDAALRKHRIWSNRRDAIVRGARRASGARWASLVSDCARADRVLKGAMPGKPWEELIQLVVGMCTAGGAAGTVKGAR